MMSNSSSPLIADLLQAIGAEWALIGADIARLGETLSAQPSSVVAMQGFDALSQNAKAQGLMLAQIAFLMRGGHIAGPALAHILDDLPLPAVRRRLLKALDLEEPQGDSAIQFWGAP